MLQSTQVPVSSSSSSNTALPLVKGLGTQNNEPRKTQQCMQEPLATAPSDRRTKPEIARKLHCFITAHRSDEEVVPKSVYTPTSKRGWGEHWYVGTQHHAEAVPQVKPLLASTELLLRAFDKLAGESAAVPASLTTLMCLSGNWHRSLLVMCASTQRRT